MRIIAALFAVLIAVLAGGLWLMSKDPWQHNGSRPGWDGAAAAKLVGRTVLIGLTYENSKGEVDHGVELHGRIVTADERHGFEIALEGKRTGETYWLPPDLSLLRPATPGTYRLRNTGEDVVDPDLLSNLIVTKPATQ